MRDAHAGTPRNGLLVDLALVGHVGPRRPYDDCGVAQRVGLARRGAPGDACGPRGDQLGRRPWVYVLAAAPGVVVPDDTVEDDEIHSNVKPK